MVKTILSLLNHRKKSLAERKDDYSAACYELKASEHSLAYNTTDSHRIARHTAAQKAVSAARLALS